MLRVPRVTICDVSVPQTPGIIKYKRPRVAPARGGAVEARGRELGMEGGGLTSAAAQGGCEDHAHTPRPGPPATRRPHQVPPAGRTTQIARPRPPTPRAHGGAETTRGDRLGARGGGTTPAAARGGYAAPPRPAVGPPPPHAGTTGHRARPEKRPRSPPARRGGERGSELGSGGGRLTSATASGGREDLGARGVATLGPRSSPLEPAHSRPRLAAPAPAPRGPSPTSRPVGGVPSPTRRKRARDTAQAGPCPLSDTHPHSDRRPSRLDPKRPRLTSTQGRHARPYDYG